jgi:hypothetical protein
MEVRDQAESKGPSSDRQPPPPTNSAQHDAEAIQFASLQQVPDDARACQHDDVAALLLAQLPDGGGRVGRGDA